MTKEADNPLVPLMAVICLLVAGCAAPENHTLPEDQLTSLKHTRTVLLTAKGVDDQHQAFFLDIFERQLKVNGVIIVAGPEKGATGSDCDATISLDCYYVDFGHFNLNRATDLRFGNSPKAATGVGKRIGCRLIVTHKNLGKFFDGQVQGTTRLAGELNEAESHQAVATPDGFSAFLERNAQEHFETELKRSRGWLYVLNMKPRP